MRGFFAGAVVLKVLALTSLAVAQEAAPPAAAPADKPAAQKASGEVRRDPKGIKGISPFWEALVKGDKAYVARDFEGAIAAFQEAIKLEPQNPLGHYRIGEAHLAKGNQKEAEESWGAALRFVRDNHKLRAKVLFVLADLRERQNSLDDATERWTEYEKFVTSQPESKGFAATPPERKKRITEWKQLSADAAEVKKRIEARLKEADEAARKSAK